MVLRMHSLLAKVKGLQKSRVHRTVKQKLLSFESFKAKPPREWFSELCFCILTANSKAETALVIQQELGPNGFLNARPSAIRKVIKRAGHRFYNNKTRFIVEARKHSNIKGKLQELLGEKGEHYARDWLVQNIKGLGYKEASHFLRNTGCKSLAILDRHILGLMYENGFIGEKPKTLSKKKYLEIEEKFRGMAEQLKMSPAELDLHLWFIKTGKVLK